MKKKAGRLTDAQRAAFFGEWWPACCAVKGWDPKDKAPYRDHILEATTAHYKANGGTPPTNSLSACTQAQLTAVFKLTWFKTDPNLTTALPVANPEESHEADEQRRAVSALSAKAPDTIIAAALAPFCRKHQVTRWQDLPSRVLKSVMHWKQFQPAKKSAPEFEEHIYQMRPSHKFVPKTHTVPDDNIPY